MSTLRANTLSDASGSNSVPMATVASGTAKAWVNFNGTGTVAIRAAFNVTSITDNGTGDYTVNFTTAMPDANYAASLEALISSLGGFGHASNSAIKTASSYRFQGARNTAGAIFDTDVNTVAIFR